MTIRKSGEVGTAIVALGGSREIYNKYDQCLRSLLCVTESHISPCHMATKHCTVSRNYANCCNSAKSEAEPKPNRAKPWQHKLDHRRYLKRQFQYHYVINERGQPENTSRYRIAESMGVVQEKQINNTYTMRYEGQQVV